MPPKRPGKTGVFVELPDDLLAELDVMCGTLPLGNRTDHIRLAIRRHIDCPPTVTTPQLPPILVEAEPPKKKSKK